LGSVNLFDAFLASALTFCSFYKPSFSANSFQNFSQVNLTCLGAIAISGASIVISERLPVEHVHIPGGQICSAVWGSFTVSNGKPKDVLAISDRFSGGKVQPPSRQTSISARIVFDSFSLTFIGPEWPE